MKTCVIIPTHNECSTIAGLVAQIRALKLDVVVIDDGSTDNTAACARKEGAFVLHNSRNQGKGKALAQGFEYILKRDFDAALTMDGDGQHLPEDIPQFLRKAESDTAGLIIGNRMIDRKNMPFIRVLTNKFMSWVISRKVRQTIADSQCGFRLIKRRLLETMTLTTNKFEIESEMIFEACRKGFSVISVPIQSVYRKEKSHINPFIDTVRFFRFLFTHPSCRK